MRRNAHDGRGALALAALAVLLLGITGTGGPAAAQNRPVATGPNMLTAEERAAADEYTRQGLEHLGRGAAALAIGDLEAALEINPLHPRATLGLADALVAVGRHGPALRHFEQAIRLEPTLFQDAHNHAVALSALGDHVRALNIVDRITNTHPDRVEAWYLAGRIRARTGEVERGKAELLRAVQLDSAHAGAALEIALLYLRADQPDSALAAFDYCSSIQINQRPALHGTIRALELLGEEGSAATRARQFNTLLETWDGIERERARLLANPRDVDAYVRLGRHHMRLRHFAAAVGMFETAIFLDPERVDALLVLGTAYSGERKFAEAELVLHRALGLEPENPEIHRELAACYRYTKDFKLSERHQHRYLELKRAQSDSSAAKAKREAENRRQQQRDF